MNKKKKRDEKREKNIESDRQTFRQGHLDNLLPFLYSLLITHYALN